MGIKKNTPLSREKIRNLNRSVMYPGDGDEDVADYRNKPCRIKMLDFVFILMHPGREYIQCKNKMHAGPDHPEPEGNRSINLQQDDREQDQADRKCWEKGDLYRVVDLASHLFEV
jgi:hypothetical protein